MGNRNTGDAILLDDSYFYFIPPDSDDNKTMTLRREFRRKMKTYYTMSEAADHIVPKMANHIKDMLIRLDFDYKHAGCLFLLLSIFSAYGFNDDKYPYGISDDISDNMQYMMDLFRERMSNEITQKYI